MPIVSAMMRRRDKELQADLILGSAVAASSPSSTPPIDVQPAEAPVIPARPRQQRAQARAKAAGNSIDIALTATAYIGVILLAGLIWYLGAFYTLLFVQSIVPSVERLHLWKWSIPLIVTAIELKMWPKPGTAKLLWAVFVSFLIFDVGSSYSGFTGWAAGRTIPLFEGFTFPESGSALTITGIILGMVFAFAPERMVRAAAAELMTLWKQVS